MEPRVDFIVIGAQKAGTTALFDYLGEVRSIGLSDVKEVHFFDDESQDWAAPDYAAYHAHFDLSDGSRVWGEATPIYTYWPPALARARAYTPDLRLIVLFRDPVGRAWSHWRMETARGAETESFEVCVGPGRVRVDDPAAPRCHRVHSYVERGFYADQVERMLSLFPRSQCLFLRSADLRAQPEAMLGAGCDFLGAPRMRSVEARLSHVGPRLAGAERPSEAATRLLMDVYAEDQAAWAALTGLAPESPEF